MADSTPPKASNVPPPSTIPGHYSGTNKIPNFKELAEKLDIGKKNRDANLDKPKPSKNAEPQPGITHTASELRAEKGQTVVTDPVTGNQVVIENSTKKGINQSDNPKVCCCSATISLTLTLM
jgi:hypothetical protein